MRLEKLEAGSRPPAGRTYWLIRGGPGPPGPLTLDLAGLGRTLPVFSFREEAEMFLALGGFGVGWGAEGRGTDDLLAHLLGDDAGVESVALDPLPAMLSDDTAGLVGLSLGRFVDGFLGPREPGAVADPG